MGILDCPNLALLAQQGPSIGVKFLPFLIQTFLFQVLPARKGAGKAGIHGKMGILRVVSVWLFPKGLRVGIYKLIPPKYLNQEGPNLMEKKKERIPGICGRKFQGRAGIFQVLEWEIEL